MPKSGEKLPKSESTRLKLLDCAVAEIIEVGPDQIGFTSVARRAEMSTGALYARYENVDELLLEVWLHRGLPALRRLIADMQESLITSTGKDARRRIADMLAGPDPELCLITKILTIARRNEAVGEFVIPSTIDAVKKTMDTTPAFDFYLAQVLGIALGVQGTGFVDMDWYAPISISASSARDATQVISVDESLPAIPEASIDDEGLDDLDRRLFGAVSRVISRVGIDNATISRIARHADINPASIYMKYDDKNALLAACITQVMTATYSQNKKLIEYFSSLSSKNPQDDVDTAAIVMFRGNQSDAHREIRLLRLEKMFGAAHHGELKSIVEKVFREIMLTDQENLGFPDNQKIRDAAIPVLIFSRFAFYGHALLREFDFVPFNHSYFGAYIHEINQRVASASLAVPRNA
jgi:AcrR family transcriptional regulator